MSTNWIYRVSLLVEAADRDAANELATKIFPNGEAERDTFSVPLNADGDSTQEPTHYGAYGVLTAELFDAVKEAVTSGVVPSLRFFAEDAETGNLLHAGGAVASRGRLVDGPLEDETAWSWDKTLEEAGLSVVTPSVIVGNDGEAVKASEIVKSWIATAKDGAL